MHFLNIPANYNFLESLYQYILDNFKNNITLSNVTIFLPSRRSVNEFKRIFLDNGKKQSIILPTIKAIGDIDYDDIIINNLDYQSLLNNNELLKPVASIKYKLLLIKSILDNKDIFNNKNVNIEQAVNLSNELNSFLIEVEQQNLNFNDLNDIVDDEYAIHWQKTLSFLKDFCNKWKNFLNDNNFISNNVCTLKKIELYTETFKNTKPDNPIIIAGNFVSIKNTLNLIRTLKQYDNTYFIFKDYEDLLKKYDVNNEDVTEVNNNYYYNKIIKELDIKNIIDLKYENCQIINDESLQTLHLSMLPYSSTYKWHTYKINKLDHIKYIECNDIYEEYSIVTFYILNFIKNNGLKNIAIVTNLEQANKIELYLKQYNLPINNTFGTRFINNNLVKYLLLVIDTCINNFSPEYLLTLLKHDFSYFGYNKKELNENIINFEKYILNDKTNCDGLKSYKKNIKLNINDGELKDKLLNFINNIEKYFEPFNNKYSLKELIITHLHIVENIASNNDIDGSMIWYNDEINQKVIDFFNKDIIPQTDFYNDINLKDYRIILNYILSEQSYSENYSIYPAINIITQQETRLINYDLVIITGLNDGNFPINISTDPWMSKSMRKKFGLPAKEIEIGKMAYDFIQLLSQKEVLLTRSLKENGVVTFKSRFLQRLETLLKCNNLSLKRCDEFIFVYNKFNEQIKEKINNDIYKIRPCPKPNLSVRPKELSATNIDLLNINPYDIYVKYILKLKEYNILEEPDLNSKLGTIIHKTIELYLNNYKKYSDNKIDSIKNILLDVIKKIFIDDRIILELYFDKIIENIEESFLILDENSRNNCDEIINEKEVDYYLNNSNMKIKAKIDRIEKLNNDVNIVDYKTGMCPPKNDVKNGKKLQLLVEALILKLGYKLNINSLQYWSIKCNGKSVNINDIDSINNLLDQTEQFLNKLFNFFNDSKNGYIATNRNEYSSYKHLSRIDDWLYN